MKLMTVCLHSSCTSCSADVGSWAAKKQNACHRKSCKLVVLLMWQLIGRAFSVFHSCKVQNYQEWIGQMFC